MSVTRAVAGASTALIVASCSGTTAGFHNPAPDPASELLSADRAFSVASARMDVISGLAAMFDAEVIMPIPGNTFADGKENAVAAL